MRVLVTGSRGWINAHEIQEALSAYKALVTSYGGTLTVVHGYCELGADRIALEWCTKNPEVVEERHPADWAKYGKRAGYVRNAEMVKLGAAACLAFIVDGSKGATMTADLAEKAGIYVRRWEVSSDDR